jgi:hypothetical protein
MGIVRNLSLRFTYYIFGDQNETLDEWISKNNNFTNIYPLIQYNEHGYAYNKSYINTNNEFEIIGCTVFIYVLSTIVFFSILFYMFG